VALTLAEFRSQYPQYDDLDDETLAKSLHTKYYSDQSWEDFSASIKYAPAQEVEPTQDVGGTTSSFGEKVQAAADRPADTPHYEGKVEYDAIPVSQRPGGKTTSAAARRDSEVQANALKLSREERDAVAMASAKLNERMNIMRAGGQKGAEDVLEDKGALAKRLIDLGIRTPEDYHLTEEEFNAATIDKVQRANAKKEGGVEAVPGARSEDAGWWKLTKTVAKSIPIRVWSGAKAQAAAHDRLAAQEATLGQMHLEKLAATYENETGDQAKKMVEDAAAEYGMTVTDYAKFTAQRIDQAVASEMTNLAAVKKAQDDIAAARPESAEDGIGWYAGKMIEQMGSVAYIAAGVATMNPVTTMALMGTDVYATTYANARLNGRSAGEAAQDAWFSASIEGGTEAIPVGKFIKLLKAGNKSRISKILSGLGTEAVQEMTVEALQIGYDIGVIGDEMSLGEAMGNIRDAGILGALMGGMIATPVAIVGDNNMTNANNAIADAKKGLQSVTNRMMNPNEAVTKAEIDTARADYEKAIRAKAKLVEERKQAEAEKKAGKIKKKEEKRKKKLTPEQKKREEAQVEQAKKDQKVERQLTHDDLRVADSLQRAADADLTRANEDAVRELLDLGYAKVTPAGTLVVLPAGKARLEAVRASQEAGGPVVEDEVIEPVEYVSPDRRARQEAVDKEIGALMRGDLAPVQIAPQKFVSRARRKKELTERVDTKIKDEAVREKIADEVVKAEQESEAYEQREQAEEQRILENMNVGYEQALREQQAVEADVALNLAKLDQKNVAGFKGTKLGKVLRAAQQRLEKAEAKAKEQLLNEFWAKPEQGTLFDISEVIVKGTKQYANLVKVGALKLAKHGAKYSAWTADMVGEFGESVKPVLAKIYNDSKKNVANVLKWSHEKYVTGARKGEIKAAPKQYAKPGQLKQLRAVLAKLAKEGKPGRMWYEKSGNAILRVVGGNLKEARKLAGLLAIYSSGTSVGPNLTNALKMWSIYQGSKTVKGRKQGTLAGRFSEQDRTALDWLRSEASDEHFVETFGDKRFPFFTNLMRSIDPKTYEYGQGVTIDLWMMRALGYDIPAPSDAQFAFGAVEMRMLAEKLGWERQQVQAAVWVAMKARWEFIQKRAKERSVKEGLAELNPAPKGKTTFDPIGESREEQIENEKKIIQVFRDEALSATITELQHKLDQSKRDFSDFLEIQYATISWEAEPSTALGLPFNDMAIEDKIAMQYEMAQLLTNPETGREYIAEWLALLGQDQFQGPGVWDGAVGAVTQNRVLAPLGHKRSHVKIKTVQDESKAAMDGYAAILGFLLKQDAVGWHRPFYLQTLISSNGAEIIGPTLNQKQTKELYSAIIAVAEENGVSREDALSFAPIVLEGATRVLNFTTIPNRQFHGFLAEAADRANIAGDIEVFQADGGLISNDWVANPNGEGYVETINNSENPKVKTAFGKAKRQFTAGVAAIHEKYAAKYGAREAEVKVSRGKVGKPPKGMLRFRHYSTVETDVLKAEKMGTGIRGAERLRGGPNVISAYPDKGFKKEVGLGAQEYVIDVPKERIYDANKDPLNLKKRSRSTTTVDRAGKPTKTRFDMAKYERLIKAEGFIGYYTPKAEGILKGQARFFTDLFVTRPEITTAFSMKPDIVQVRENELDEFEVREKNGEIYYTSEVDDAIGTARRIHGADVTIEVVDVDGDVILTDVPTGETAEVLKLGSGISAMSIDDFMVDWMNETTTNMLNEKERLVDDVAGVELRPSGGDIYIDSIRAFEAGQGAGNAALAKIIEIADRNGVRLRLTAQEFVTGATAEGQGLSNNDLIKWYERNGFVRSKSPPGMEDVSNTMRRDPNVVTPKFAKFERGVGISIPKAETERFVSSIMQNVFEIENFKVVDDVSQFPRPAYAQVVHFGLADKVSGMFYEDPIDGPTIYVVAKNITDIKTLVETVLHETVGHFGLRALLGAKEYNYVMDAIRRAFPQEVQRRGKDLAKDADGRRLAAEETFAYMVQDELNGLDLTKVKTSFVDRVINAISMFLVKIGAKKMSRNDLLQLMFRSVDFLRNNPQAVLQKRALQVQKHQEADAVLANTQMIISAAELDPGLLARTMKFSVLEKSRKVDPDLDRFLNKIGHSNRSRLQRLRDWWDARSDNLARAFEIEMLDQFAGIRHAEEDLGIFGAQSGYMSVRLTAGTDVIIRSALENAVPVWDAEGTVKMDSDVRGLIEILAPIGKSPEMLKAFEMFLVARRARRLTKQQRENLFTREELAAAFNYVRKNKLYGLFKNTANDLAEYKSKILDFAEEAGLIDPASRKLWEHHDHIPFYRALSGNDKTGPFAASRIGHIGKVIHRLKGGTDALKNPLESIVQNIGALIEASVKNRAMADVVKNFTDTGVITKAPQAEMTKAIVPLKQVRDMLNEAGVGLDTVGNELLEGIAKLTALQAPTADNIVSVQEKGKRMYYYVHDKGVMRGMDNVSPTQWTSLMRVLRFPKRVLTRAITLMPDFIFKNWFRDMWHAFVLHRHGVMTPGYDSVRGWAKAIAQDKTWQDILSGGGMFDSGYVNASDPKKTNLAIRKGVLGAGRHNILDTPRKLAKFYMRIANGAENAHRIVVYQKALKKTGSRKQALFESRDLMDFSVRGANPVVRFLTETVPFWGARVQGLSRTAKGFRENPALTMMRGAPIVLATMALYAINRDDERYKKLNDYEKRMYYHFYDVFEENDHWRLPKPFEVGAIFSSIPETLMEFSLSEEPDRARVVASSIAWIVREQLMLAPDIQAFNPIFELMINENRFTESPIVSKWEEQKDPKEQHSYRTNKTIKEIAQNMPEWAPEWARSPKQLEHLVSGYFGSAMDYALVASDLMYYKAHEDEAQPPTMRWDETPFVKAFRREPEGKYDKYLESMYEVMGEANRIHNSITQLKKEKTPEAKARRKELEERHEALLYARKRTDKWAKRVSEFNKRIRATYANKNMTPTQKRERVDMLLKKRSQAAEKAYDYRPGGKKNRFDGGEPVDSYYDRVTDFLNGLIGKPKDEQVDDLIGAHLPHTATLINDITISDEKLKKIA
jgi:hypothetical protein